MNKGIPKQTDNLPDPKVIGNEYRKTATIHAVRMSRKFIVETLEGTEYGNKGDWLARGVKGELYIIRDDIFKETYTQVE